MIARARLAAVAASLLALALGASACSSGANANAPDPSAGFTMEFPPVVGGLSLALDKKATTKLAARAGKDTYVRNGEVFTLRLGTGPKAELKAVLQVIRLTPDARPDDPEFRRNIACKELLQGSCRTPQLDKATGALVYIGKQGEGTPYEQDIFLWFTSRFMETLVVRKDQSGSYDLPTLLNQLWSVKPVRVSPSP